VIFFEFPTTQELTVRVRWWHRKVWDTNTYFPKNTKQKYKNKHHSSNKIFALPPCVFNHHRVYYDLQQYDCEYRTHQISDQRIGNTGSRDRTVRIAITSILLPTTEPWRERRCSRPPPPRRRIAAASAAAATTNDGSYHVSSRYRGHCWDDYNHAECCDDLVRLGKSGIRWSWRWHDETIFITNNVGWVRVCLFCFFVLFTLRNTNDENPIRWRVCYACTLNDCFICLFVCLIVSYGSSRQQPRQ